MGMRRIRTRFFRRFRRVPAFGRGCRRAALSVLLLALAGCSPTDRDVPPPVPIDDEATGHYCGMLLVEHPGPKAQIRIEGRRRPLWFASIADGFAYLRGGEREGRILAFYVQDMGRAKSWRDPGRDAWIPAEAAFYVHGGDRRNGMGGPALVPFADRAAARDFVRAHGGRILRYEDVRALPPPGAGKPDESGPAAEEEKGS